MQTEIASEKWIIEELEPKDYIFETCWKAVKTWKVIHNKWGGYTENELSFHLMQDGSFIIRDGNNMISMSVEQREVLKELLAIQK